MRMKRNGIAVLLLFVIMTQLTGCFFKSGDELYSLPQPPAIYLDLQSRINAVLATGAEYAAPSSGANSQSVQLVDIDGDGEAEALAFFRFTGDKPLRIYIFKIIGGVYKNVAVIEGSGTSIDSIWYADINGNGNNEIIVGWQISADIHAMTVYSLDNFQVTELMVSSYTKYQISDLDNNGTKDIVVLRFDTEDGRGVAEYYKWEENALRLSDQVRLSFSADAFTRVKAGQLQKSVPALFVTGTYGANGIITDILACRDGRMVNIALKNGISQEVARYLALYPMDLNGDSVIELPQPVQLPVFNDKKTSDFYWTINWRTYSLDGTVSRVGITYHDNADGWYLTLPESWENQITISRRDAVSGERTVVFSIWKGKDTKPVDFLAIYTLTGDNRENRSNFGSRFVLAKQVETIYAAEFLDGNMDWQYKISKDNLISRFNLIKKDWMS